MEGLVLVQVLEQQLLSVDIGHVALVLLALSCLAFARYVKRANRRLRLPPSPPALPIIGHLHLLSQIPHQALHKLSQGHGGLIHLRLGSVHCVVASSAEVAREILRAHDASFADRPQLKVTTYLAYGASGFAFALHGPYWRFVRKLCMSELLSSRTLQLLLPVRSDEIAALLRRVQHKSAEGKVVDVGSELMQLTNNVISRMLMSQRCSGSEGESEEARKVVEEVAKLVVSFNLSDYFGIFKHLDLQGLDRRTRDTRRRFDGIMDKILEDKEKRRKLNKIEEREQAAVKDLVDILMDISEDPGAEFRLTREGIKAFVLDIFVAGTDTSALTIEWALAELINHPNILEKARDEIDTVVGKERVMAESDIPNLPYLQSIVKETLRRHPTASLIMRQSKEECKISGYDVPASALVFINAWSIGRDPKHWEEPLEFRPERFMEKNVDVRGQHSEMEMVPFGGGRRACPGASLAMQLVQSALGALIQCFEWETEGGRPVDMTEGGGLTIPRAKPLMCRPLPRMNSLPIN